MQCQLNASQGKRLTHQLTDAVSGCQATANYCKPATFGFEGEDVLDEKIRKAGKLEASELSTSFNPYDYGIVGAVAHALLPGILRPDSLDVNTNAEHWGVVAELYKLNVYSGPSGIPNPHVDWM